MNTEIGLLAAFGDSIIPVSDVCEPFFNCKKQTAHQKIKAYTFPIPAFRMADSNKNEFFVTTEDLATYIDQEFEDSTKALGKWIAYFCFNLPQLAYICGGYCSEDERLISSESKQ
ncbi:pyocin activator PrtN family protein [Vibrio nigripulchritudo]|uniref:pyocin activator PrtN family protein n=1 Tax=Vibrio nigripulchritudo TaxID=28173 RepID=UPI002491E05C|nr:pyocin activator PrtN family protein [Vibrio nigripulchritudo]BDU38722.1 hypothetical protein TUMSATVNIG2_31910 [Vibrio nigripulchritudo]BDU44442.1 hypothetical protein TUMSATVNIG3_32400 [Vibrio nigripulchritudo]